MDHLTFSSQLQLGYGKRVPDIGIPLAHINIPSIQSPHIIGAEEQSPDNTSGLYRRYLGESATINVVNSTVGMAATGTVIYSKLADPTFANGVTNWSRSSGDITFSETGGRTSANSSYDSESVDQPAFGQAATYQPYCAMISWASSGSVVLASDLAAARTGDEAVYAKENVAYQLGLWIKTDQVDSHGYRRDATGNTVDIRGTRIKVEVIGYDVSNNPTETCTSEIISYYDLHRRHYLTQSSPWFLRFRTPLFRVASADTTQLGVVITCENSRGVYFDDVVLTSFAYVSSIRINTGDAPVDVQTTTIYLPGGWIDATMVNINQTFIDNTNQSYVISSAGDVVINGGFEEGTGETLSTWTGTATRKTGIGIGGNWGALFNSATDYVTQDIAVNYAQTYTAKLNYKANVKSRYGSDPNVILVVQALTGADALVSTYSTTGSTSGTGSSPWKELSLSIDFSGDSSIEKVKFTLLNTTTTSTKQMYIDDVKLISPTAAITGWYVYDKFPYYTDFYSVLNYDSKNHLFAAYWLSGSSDQKRHYIIPVRDMIFQDQDYANTVTIDDCNKYWNTTDKLITESLAIDETKRYKVAMFLGWKESSPGATNINNLFSVPYRMKYSPATLIPKFSYSFYNSDNIIVNEYGSIILNIEYFDTGGSSLGTAELANISREKNNLPRLAIKHVDPETGISYPYYYSEAAKSSMLVPPAGATTCKLTITMRGTRCGIKQVWMAEFSQKQIPQTGTTTFTGLTAGEDIEVYSFTDKLLVDGIERDISGSWFPTLKDGIFERSYTVQTYEPTGGLLYQTGWRAGDSLKLIYTIPEFALEPRYNAEQHITEAYRVEAEQIDEHTLFLRNKFVDSINYLSVNGTVIVSGSPIKFENLSAVYSDVSTTNSENGTITLNRTIHPRDEVIATYAYRQYRYVYRGFYDGKSWHDIDLNPSYGHRFHVGVDGKGRSTSELLNSGLTLYAIPTAAYTASGNTTGNYLYRSSFSLPTETRPTHYIKHVVGTNLDEVILSKEPYAVILGKIFITPPCSLSDIKLLDLRPRGGGLPEDYDYPPDFTEEFRIKLPCNTTNWANSRIELGVGDRVVISGFGSAPGSGTVSTISPSGSIFGCISSTLPTTGDTVFHISTSYSTVITSATTGLLYTRVYNQYQTTGDMYLRVLVTRKAAKKGRWDTGASWEGEPVMLNGVVVVEVPSDVLTGANGYRQLTAKEVEDAVNKHVAAGVLPIVRYV